MYLTDLTANTNIVVGYGVLFHKLFWFCLWPGLFLSYYIIISYVFFYSF